RVGAADRSHVRTKESAMHRFTALAAGAIAALAGSNLVRADIIVRRYDANLSLIQQLTFDHQQAFSFAVSSSDALVYVYSNNGAAENIPEFTITQPSGSTSSAIQVVLAQDGANPGGPFDPSDIGGAGLGGLNTTRPNIELSARLGIGAVTGTVTASWISWFESDGRIQEGIVQGLSASDSFSANNGLTVISRSFE